MRGVTLNGSAAVGRIQTPIWDLDSTVFVPMTIVEGCCVVAVAKSDGDYHCVSANIMTRRCFILRGRRCQHAIRVQPICD